MAVAAVALSFGVGPLAHHVQHLAEWIVQGLVPWLTVLVVFMYLSLLRATLRCPVRVYVGTDPKIRRVVKRCPSFQKDYRPPAWAAGAWAQAVIYLYRSWRNQHLRGLIREQVELPDGEFVHLMWMLPPSLRTEATISSSNGDSLDESDAPNVPPNVPIVVICHGVFQSAPDLYEFCSFLTNECGYLPCVFSRRGNDTPLSRPRFNTVGDQEDFRFILSRIRNRFPTHRMYGVGISAGSSLLARYLGDAGEDAELDGGVLVSPGYDMEKSLRHMTPLADMVITLHAKSFFLTRNKDTLASSEHQDGLRKLYRSRSMHEFHQHMHVFDGKASSEEYFNTHNPSRVLDQIRKPSVYINAYDDMCFPGDFTFQYKNLVDRCHHALVLHMEKGGHGTFYEGWDAGTSRFFQVVREFVDCLHTDEGFADKAAEAGSVVEATAAAAAPAPSVTVTKTRMTTLTTMTRGEEEDVVATRTKQRKEVVVVAGPQSCSGSTTMTTTTVMREVRCKGEGVHEVVVKRATMPPQ